MYDAQNGLEYPGSIEINILEIPKRRGNISKVSHWLEFFAARTEEQFMQLAQNDSAMEQAWGIIKHMSADEQERAEAEAVEKARRDMVARLHSAEMLGHTKGLEEGKAEGKAEVALAMLQGGLSIEQISGFTGLTADEIQGLRKLQ